MFTTAHTPLRDTVTAIAATMICTTLSLVALDSPAHAATRSGFVHKVERQLSAQTAPTEQSGVATVAVRLDAAARVMSTDLVTSTGHEALDRAALSTAKNVIYPKDSGARTVAVVLTFNDAQMPSRKKSASLVSRYVNEHGEAFAASRPAPNAG